MKLLKVLRKKTIIYTILAIITTLVQSVEAIYEAQFSADLINSAVTGKVISPSSLLFGWETWNIAFLIIGLSFFGFFNGLLSVYFSAKAATFYVADLRKDSFAKIQSFSYQDIDNFSTSSLVTRLTTDIQTIFLGLVFGLRFFTKGICLFIYGLSLSIVDYQELSIIYAALIPAILIIIGIVSWKALPNFMQTRKNIDGVNKISRETILGIRVVKAFNLEEKENEEFGYKVNDLMKSSIKAFTLIGILLPIIQTLVNIALVVVLYIGSVNPTNLGNVVGFVNILMQVLFGFIALIMVFVQLASAIPSFKRLNEILNWKVSINYNNDSQKQIKNGKIEFKNVSYKFYQDSAEVLSKINLTINPNEKIGIIGRTGSGKTTFVNLLARLFDPTEGEILIDDINIKDYSFSELNKKISIAMQEVVLFSGTILSNIAMGLEDDLTDSEKEEKVIEAAKIAEAWEFISKKVDLLNSEVEQRGKNFSGGQKQRISIARTIAKKPKILIFDDSTSALDNLTEKKVQKNVSNFFKSTTLIVAQRISSIENLDRIIVIENGEISGYGKHEDLLMNNGIYKDIAISQWGQDKFDKTIKEINKKGVKNA
ncbi:MAG: ABC transporter ATP-binding protein [Metamycoplasmataceae bacterium]